MPDGFKLPDFWYTPYFVKYASSLDELRLVRTEYTRMRDQAQKRIKRLQAAGYKVPEFAEGSVPRLRNIANQSELGYQFARLYDFLRNPQSTVKGYRSSRQKTLETLHKPHAGVDLSFVNEGNLDQFGQFMELYRLSGIEKVFSYSELGQVFTQVSQEATGRTRKSIAKKLEKAFRRYVKEQYGLQFKIKKEDRPKWWTS